MEADEIMSWISRHLEPMPAREWFIAAAPDIEDAVVAAANADGLPATLKMVKELYVSWRSLSPFPAT